MPAYQVKFETVTVGAHAFEIRSLKDRQQYAYPDKTAHNAGVPPASWPLFGVLWPSGIMLADVMDTYLLKGLRVLEVGCGLGLASLVAHRHGADITASDYHPLAAQFMAQNIKLNKLDPLEFKCINWKTIDNIAHPRMKRRRGERRCEESSAMANFEPGLGDALGVRGIRYRLERLRVAAGLPEGVSPLFAYTYRAVR